jgi:predicted Zn-dependent protease
VTLRDLDSDALVARFRSLVPAVDYCALRVVDQFSQLTSVRQDVPEPPHAAADRGAMITVIDGDGLGYAATSDLSDARLRDAIAHARAWAQRSRGRSVFDSAPRLPSAAGTYRSPTVRPMTLSKADRIELLMRESRACKRDPRIVDWAASLWTTQVRQLLATADGGIAHQEFDYTVPALHVTAFADGLTQTRSWGGRHNGVCQQGGAEVLERSGFVGSGAATAEEALQLLAAPNCPSGRFDIVLMPDQMMLQIHESIGHPLELDRILGDERNYAGTSFVTLPMFGSYRYGSELLNVTYDPTRPGEFASFAADDDGEPARREYLIRDGLLLRPLGGGLSQQRAALPGVATTRACGWNRPPIDRMSNLNVEPGGATLDELIASVDDGILMKTNVSWSIDDSRNKFQFGCEWGQRIRGGRLAEVVRNPNYRGVSATFWRSLAMVGDESTVEVMGTPFCGKGEPNQGIRVGHASPACRFTGVDVFGAER